MPLFGNLIVTKAGEVVWCGGLRFAKRPLMAENQGTEYFGT